MKSLFLLLLLTSLLSSCGESQSDTLTSDTLTKNDLVGRKFDLDAFHVVEFKTESRYWIYQKPLNCGGEGNWSISNEKVVLENNDSNCESTKKMATSYSFSRFE